MSKPTRLLLLATFLLACISPTAAAIPTAPADADDSVAEPIRSVTDRLYLHAHFNRSGFALEEARGEAGQGFGVRLGYGFSQRFTFYSGLDLTFMNTQDPFMQDLGGSRYALGHFDIGGQFNLRNRTNRIVPFVDVSFTGTVLVYKVNGRQASYRGSGASIGGGVKYFLTPSLSVDTGVYGTASILDEYENGGAIERISMNTGSVRFNVGFSWYFGR